MSLGGRLNLEMDESALDVLFSPPSTVERTDAALAAEACGYQPKRQYFLDCKSVLNKGYVGRKSAKIEVLLHSVCKIICAKKLDLLDKTGKKIEISLLYEEFVQFTSC